MKKAWIFAVVGLLFVITMGPLIWGALASLSWSNAADTNDLREAAYRLYRRTGLTPPTSAMDMTDRQSCSETYRRKDEDGVRHLAWVLDDARDRMIRAKYNDRAIQTIEKLPKPIVGALDACMSGSPASPLCVSYVSKLTAQAFAVPRSVSHSWQVAADTQSNAAWCAAGQSIQP